MSLIETVASSAAPRIEPDRPVISVIGLGYVGAVSAACFSQIGHRVIGVDLDRRKVDAINAGRGPVVEADLDSYLGMGLEEGLVSATTNIVESVLESDITFVCVGTPSNESGAVDLAALRACARDIGDALSIKNGRHLVVIRSTIPATTTRNVVLPLLEAASGKTCGEDFGLCFHPEFLREGVAIADFFDPPKTVIGQFDERSGEELAALYADIKAPLIRTSLEAAEMVKYVDNTWHAVKVAFANEVGKICRSMEVDSHDVMNIFVQDRKLNLSPYYMKPGFAFGGSCLPKDVRAMNGLASEGMVEVPLIDSLLRSNDSHIDHAMRLVAEAAPRRVCLLGVTFKPFTDDLRESPQLELLGRLIEAGYDVRVYDANVNAEGVKLAALYAKTSSRSMRRALEALPDLLADSARSAMRGSDLIIAAHNTPEFVDAVQSRNEKTGVVDLVRLPAICRTGAGYRGVCW